MYIGLVRDPAIQASLSDPEELIRLAVHIFVYIIMVCLIL